MVEIKNKPSRRGKESREAEKEPKLAQQGAHMEERREKHGSKGNAKLMMERYTYESISPDTDDGNKFPPCVLAQTEEGPCDLKTKENDTLVGSEQLSTAGRLAPDRERERTSHLH